MAEVNVGKLYKVEFWEYERGWGAKIDEVKYYDNLEEADKVVQDFNSKNTETEVPDWYMIAKGPYKV